MLSARSLPRTANYKWCNSSEEQLSIVHRTLNKLVAFYLAIASPGWKLVKSQTRGALDVRLLTSHYSSRALERLSVQHWASG